MTPINTENVLTLNRYILKANTTSPLLKRKYAFISSPFNSKEFCVWKETPFNDPVYLEFYIYENYY